MVVTLAGLVVAIDADTAGGGGGGGGGDGEFTVSDTADAVACAPTSATDAVIVSVAAALTVWVVGLELVSLLAKCTLLLRVLLLGAL